MRDPNRIERIVEVLRGVWEQNPDLRLGQLISNVCPNDTDLFYVEDDVWEDRLWRYMGMTMKAGKKTSSKLTY